MSRFCFLTVDGSRVVTSKRSPGQEVTQIPQTKARSRPTLRNIPSAARRTAAL
ncbi:MAG: hypothetical protein HDS09_07845 [Bacteroides sp.]|nr:hypothetical protein [Bacteroides sp.]